MAFPVLHSVLLLLVSANAACSQKECEADHECSADSFCYAQTGVCAPCITCGAYNRKVATFSCAKEWEDCGGCAKGFREEAYSNRQRRSVCVRDDVVNSNGPPPGEGVSHYVPIATTLAIAGSICAAVVIFTFIKKGRSHRSVTVGPRDVECPQPEAPLLTTSLTPVTLEAGPVNEDASVMDGDRPPPYSQHYAAVSPPLKRPTAPPDPSFISTICTQVDEPQEDKLLQATPFISPQSPYGSSEEEEELEVEEPNHTSPSRPPLNFDDESTLPCHWVPGYSYENAAGTLEDSRVSNVSSNPGSSNVTFSFSTAQPTVPQSFQGFFPRAGHEGVGVAEPRRESHSPERSERPAKRFRGESDANAANASSDDEAWGEDNPVQVTVVNHIININNTHISAADVSVSHTISSQVV